MPAREDLAQQRSETMPELDDASWESSEAAPPTEFESDGELPPVESSFDAPSASASDLAFGDAPVVVDSTQNDGIALPADAQIDYDAANQQLAAQPEASEGGVRGDVETVLGANDAKELYGAATGAEGGGSIVGGTFSAVSAGANFANAIDDGARGDYGGATAEALDGGLNAAAALGVEAAGVPAAVGGMIIEGEKATKESGLYGQFANGEQKSGMDVAMSAVTSVGDTVHNAVGSTSMAGQLAGDLTEQALFAPAAAAGAVYDFGAGVVSTAEKAYDLGTRGVEAAGSAISAGWDWLTGAGPQQEDNEGGGE